MRKILILIPFFIWGCEKTNQKNEFLESNSIDTTITIDVESIKSVALKNFLALHPEEIKGRNEKSAHEYFPELDTTFIIKDKKGRNAIHIFRYKNNKGWNIISGDNRFYPILAYNKETNSKLDTSLNPGLKYWVDDIIQQIDFMDMNRISQSEGIRTEWVKYLSKKEVNSEFKNQPADTTEGCTEYAQVWANLNNNSIGFTGLSWNQTAGFNFYMPNDWCEPHSYYCDKFPAGCGPVAIGMIMKYYQKPLTYIFNGNSRIVNYQKMPKKINPYLVICNTPIDSIEETSAFLKIIAGKFAEMWCFSVSVPFYYSSKSATSLNPNKISLTFSDWGYTYPGNKIDYSTNITRLINNLKQRKPVIFSGSSCDVCLWNAHIWLCEGLSEYISSSCTVVDMVYMNWGWGGNDNGWFGIGNSYTAGGVTFNNANMKIIVDINP